MSLHAHDLRSELRKRIDAIVANERAHGGENGTHGWQARAARRLRFELNLPIERIADELDVGTKAVKEALVAPGPQSASPQRTENPLCEPAAQKLPIDHRELVSVVVAAAARVMRESERRIFHPHYDRRMLAAQQAALIVLDTLGVPHNVLQERFSPGASSTVMRQRLAMGYNRLRRTKRIQYDTTFFECLGRICAALDIANPAQ